MSRKRPPVAIIGGGLAGLSAAHTLRQYGVPVVLFEASDQLAGLARSFKDADGFSYDFGAHFITNRLAAALGMGGRCRTVEQYGETVWLQGQSHSYPLGLLTRPRYELSALWSRLRGLVPGLDAVHDAATWFRQTYGAALADEVALPILRAWSGVDPRALSPAVGDKIPGSLLRTLWLRTAGRLTRRAVAIGYCRTLPESAHVWHVYPEGGLGSLCEKLAAEVGDVIRLNSRVQKVYVEDGRVKGVRVNDRDRAVAAAISTAPVHVLPKLVEGTDTLAPYGQFRYRPMVFVNLRLQGRDLLPDVVTWLPEDDFLGFRLTEAPRSMPWLAPPGRTMITVDIGCEVGDPVWTMDEDQLVNLCLDDLAALVPDVRRRYLGHRVLRTPIAYPVFLRAYEPERQRLQRGTGVDGLLSVGRNGEFDHLLMEDVYCRTVDRARRLAHELAA